MGVITHAGVASTDILDTKRISRIRRKVVLSASVSLGLKSTVVTIAQARWAAQRLQQQCHSP
jgi:hypothetical protein